MQTVSLAPGIAREPVPAPPVHSCATPNAPSCSGEAEGDLENLLAIEAQRAPGAFLGLRMALLFNLGIAVAGLVAYEIWSLLQPVL